MSLARVVAAACAVLCVFTSGAVAAATGPESAAIAPREGHPAVFLSWDAPYGMPGARNAVSAACDDTLAADTLYVTFDPGEDRQALLGLNASLTFRAAPGDSLGPFWDLARSGANPWNLRIEFDDPPAGCPSPWPVAGMGAPRYQLSRDAGRLDLSYFVNASLAGPVVAGTRYLCARVMLRLRRPHLAGCRQPVCVELNHVKLSYLGGGRWINSGERFVSWNSAGGEACRAYRERPPEPEPLPFGGATLSDTTRR